MRIGKARQNRSVTYASSDDAALCSIVDVVVRHARLTGARV